MKKILLTVTGFIAVAMLFTGVGYAAANWVNFTGDEEIEKSQNNVDEILEILKEVSEGKITAEEAELRLEGEVAKLTEDKGILNNQLTGAKKDIEYLEGLLEGFAGETPGQKIKKLKEANDNLRSQNAQLEADLQNEKDDNEELQASITGLQEDNERLQGTIGLRDNEIVGLKNDVADLKEKLANAPEDQKEYVAHLEAELERANSLVETHHKATSEALEEAENYK